MHIESSYVAYCVDEAVARWGNYVTAELDKIEGKNAKKVAARRQSKLLSLLEAPAEMRFKSLRSAPGR